MKVIMAENISWEEQHPDKRKSKTGVMMMRPKDYSWGKLLHWVERNCRGCKFIHYIPNTEIKAVYDNREEIYTMREPTVKETNLYDKEYIGVLNTKEKGEGV